MMARAHFPSGERPQAIAFSEAHDGTAIGLPKADRVVRAGGSGLVIEKQHAPIPRKKRARGVIEPGEIALGACAGGQDGDLVTKVVTSHEPAPGAGDVVHRQPPGAAEGDPPVSGEIDAVEGLSAPCRAGGEEDLVACLRPGKALLPPIVAGEDGALSRPVHDDDRPAVVPLRGVLEEGDPVASGRDTKVAQVARGLVEHLADRELQPVLPVRHPNDGQLGAVGRPVGLTDILEDLSRGGAPERDPGERADEQPMRGRSGRWSGRPAPPWTRSTGDACAGDRGGVARDTRGGS